MPIPPCPQPESHAAHMGVNGECPWCGAHDETQINPFVVICDDHGNPDCGLC